MRRARVLSCLLKAGLAVGIASGLVVTGCNSPTGMSKTGHCDTPESITVTAGVQPTFSWSTACEVNTLNVFEDSAGVPDIRLHLMWSLTYGTGGNIIQSPVSYGDSVPNVPRAAAEALQPGVAYRLRILQGYVREDYQSGWRSVGSTVFTP